MPSPKRSPKGSPKKGGKTSPGKKSSKLTAEDQEACERFFARKRYSTMDAVFKQTSSVLSIYARSIHLYEIWNRLPPYEQFNSSASPKKSPKSGKASPKKSPKGGASKSPAAVAEELLKPECEPAEITGIISIHKSRLVEGRQLFVEVTAEFRYCGHSKVPPFPDNVISKCQCFRDIKVLYPIRFDQDEDISPFNQNLIFKLRKTMGRGYRFFQYSFDVTRKPDSLFFTRPFYPDFSSGLFWKLRAFLAQGENCTPIPEEQIEMEFFKYTICPALTPFCLRETPPVEYTRYCTQNDTGDLLLKAQLDRDIYYHGQEIKVKISIENNSSRHVVDTIAVFVEQTYRLFHQFPHDSSIPIGEVILHAGEAGLPINPRSKNFAKEVLLKPEYDSTKYNLAIDGKMSVDKKVFLASSTIIMMATKVTTVTVEEPPPVGQIASPKGSPKAKNQSPKGKGASPKNKKGSPKSKSPKPEKSPPKNTVAAPTVPIEEPEPITEPRLVVTMNEVNQLTNKQACRSAFVAYDVVVRLNLRTPNGDESGHPQVRLPFILTRETRFLDKLSNPPPPPVWGIIKPH